MAKRRKVNEPAAVNYFFGPGWEQLRRFLSVFWEYNREDIRKIRNKMDQAKGGKLSIRGISSVFAVLALIIFGTLFFILISSCLSILLAVVFLLVYLFVFLAWISDRIYLLSNRIFVACPNCKEKSLIPAFICPGCGARHEKLSPGRYGSLYRRCRCGRRIPSHVFTGRARLEAHCPSCDSVLNGTVSVPVCVPVIGGRSTGKTAYINAFSYDFIEKAAPRNGWTIRHYSPEMEEFYRDDICRDYEGGFTRMTSRELDVQQASSKAFSFFVGGKDLKPERLIQLYDVAGETFVDNTENEQQLQYDYCHGIIFMVDPLVISEIRNRADETVDAKDRNSLGTENVDLIVDAFMNKLRNVTGLDEAATSSIPIAVLVSKSDIPMLETELGEERIREALQSEGLTQEYYQDMENEVCRRFLQEYLPALVQAVEMKFRHTRYFACSAIGHTRETGAYSPRGVLEPMEWICNIADPGLRRAWREHEFNKKRPTEKEKNKQAEGQV